jgi:polygalacturonase
MIAPTQAADVRSPELKGDDVTDDSGTLSKAVCEGGVELVVPKGIYLLGAVNVQEKVTLRGTN